MAAFEAMERDEVVEVGGEVLLGKQGEQRSIALNRLFLSERNVRKVCDPETIPGLAASIEAEGLIYPLCVVVEKRKGFKGEWFGVVAGGRRLAALLWLVKQGRLAADAPVECLLFEARRGVALSLTENTQQEQMHPADEVLAFKTLVEQEGRTAGQIAAAFGVTVLTVERRLKLANLAPVFIDLYREGKIEQQQLQALTLAADHEQQVKAWEALPSYNRSAYHIRQMLTDGEISAQAPVAAFVGIDAYRDAGGAVRVDLFAAEGGAYLQDGALLHRLALEKLEAEAHVRRSAGWKWVEARMDFPHSERSRFAQLRSEAFEPNRQERAAIDALEADLDRIRACMDELEMFAGYDEEADEEKELTDEQQAEYQALESQWGVLDDQRDAMHDALRKWAPVQKTVAGVVLSIGRDGALATVEGLVRPEDRKAVAAAHDAGKPAPSAAYDSAPKERAEFSAALCQSLTAHRTAAVAATLTQSPTIALAALLHTLIVSEREPWQSSPIDVRFAQHGDAVSRAAAEYDLTPAARALAQAEAWGDHLPGDSARLFDHLQAMDLSGLLDLLARCIARAYSVKAPEPGRSHGRGFDPARGIEAALGIDMADWWAPTAERFLAHVSKAKMIEAVTESSCVAAARPIEKMKKVEAVAAAAALLDGKRWLPTTLRPYPAPVADSVVEGDENEG